MPRLDQLETPRARPTPPARPRVRSAARPAGLLRLLEVSLFTLSFLVVGCLLFPAAVPTDWVYGERLSYEYFRDNHADLDVAIREIADEVKREELTDYVFLLGDSVTYSARSAEDVSLGVELEKVANEDLARRAPASEGATPEGRQAAIGRRPVRVFCLAEPSMQIGDVYVVVLKLQAAGLDTSHIVCNLLYGGFVARTPFPPVVFWLEKDLARLDPASYARVRDHLAQARLDPLLRPAANPAATLDRWAVRTLYPLVPPLAYRDFVWSAAVRLATGQDPKLETFDPRPWTEKPHLVATLARPEYQNAFSDAPFVLDETNPEVYFLGKIREVTQGGQAGGQARRGQVLFFLSPVNQVLMKDNVSKPGYQENVRRVGEWFAQQGAQVGAVPGAAAGDGSVAPAGAGASTGAPPAAAGGGPPAAAGGSLIYLDLEAAVPDGLFADHLHLTGEGHRYLAEILWRAMAPGFAEGGVE